MDLNPHDGFKSTSSITIMCTRKALLRYQNKSVRGVTFDSGITIDLHISDTIDKEEPGLTFSNFERLLAIL